MGNGKSKKKDTEKKEEGPELEDLEPFKQVFHSDDLYGLSKLEDEQRFNDMENFGEFLPVDCIHEIMLYLPLKDLFTVVSLTCKLFHGVCNTNGFWRDFYATNFEIDPTTEHHEEGTNFKMVFFDRLQSSSMFNDYFSHKMFCGNDSGEEAARLLGQQGMDLENINNLIMRVKPITLEEEEEEEQSDIEEEDGGKNRHVLNLFPIISPDLEPQKKVFVQSLKSELLEGKENITETSEEEKLFKKVILFYPSKEEELSSNKENLAIIHCLEYDETFKKKNRRSRKDDSDDDIQGYFLLFNTGDRKSFEKVKELRKKIEMSPHFRKFSVFLMVGINQQQQQQQQQPKKKEEEEEEEEEVINNTYISYDEVCEYCKMKEIQQNTIGYIECDPYKNIKRNVMFCFGTLVFNGIKGMRRKLMMYRLEIFNKKLDILKQQALEMGDLIEEGDDLIDF